MRALVVLSMGLAACTYAEKHPSEEVDGGEVDAELPIDAIDAPEGFRIGGRVEGMWTGAAVQVRLQAGDVNVLETVEANGTFALAPRMAGHEAYLVTIEGQPERHQCAVTGGSGTMTGADVTTVAIACVGPAVSIVATEPIGFHPGTLAYVIALPIVTTTIDVTALPGEDGTAAIDGVAATTARRIELAAGESVHTVDFAIGALSQRYTITIDRGGRAVAATYAKAVGAAAGDRYGDGAVAITADRMVIGAPGRASDARAESGAVFVYRRMGAAWIADGVLTAGADGTALDRFGCAVAVSVDTIAVGACGEDSATTGVNPQPNEQATESGAVYVFVLQGGQWVRQAFVKAANVTSGDDFGTAVALYGDLLVVGAPGEDGSAAGVDGQPNELRMEAGAAYVFRRTGATWAQVAYLKAAATRAQARFGSALALDGGTIAVGAANEGAAYVFAPTASSWMAPVELRDPSAAAGTGFGWQLAVSGDRLAVAMPGGQTGAPNGEVQIFRRSGGAWSFESRLLPPIAAVAGRFGYGLALVRDVLLVADDLELVGGVAAGAVHVYGAAGTAWVHRQRLVAPAPGAADHFGNRAVVMAPGTIVVGAGFEDSATQGIGGNGGDDNAPDSGAAYLFR